MPELLQRAFNVIGAILFFVATGVTGHGWFAQARFEEDEERIEPARLLLVLIITSAANCILYSIDVVISIRKSLTGNA